MREIIRVQRTYDLATTILPDCDRWIAKIRPLICIFSKSKLRKVALHYRTSWKLFTYHNIIFIQKFRFNAPSTRPRRSLRTSRSWKRLQSPRWRTRWAIRKLQTKKKDFLDTVTNLVAYIFHLCHSESMLRQCSHFKIMLYESLVTGRIQWTKMLLLLCMLINAFSWTNIVEVFFIAIKYFQLHSDDC